MSLAREGRGLGHSSEAHAWGAYHAGYTHVGPSGVYHAGTTSYHGGYGGGYHSGGGYHYGGASGGGGYHYGYARRW